ncbi:LPS assembly protein LptD [Alphaproteobacteria bacterium GH1-50]|uniref:LPS-assembly protein LptD n=1 Tax=Kangsaoukella pontilimi TaxID=2691042 RepID=A0A7C9MVB5_9RHOB|nr:LPS assembly protein LptD [Kangsaoukella pontilimi]MXQ07540.1 LPS assembly protein LptD [Kangsaoukella pontilimi]
MIRALLLILALTFAALPAAAQAPATLVADSVLVEPTGRIVASGNVEVWQDGTRLTADRVVYDRRSDRLTVEGPITVTEPGGTVFAATEASLSPDLRAGLLRSARLVLDQQLQLAAAELARVNDRYTTLDRVVASSCEVCAANPTPLWEIRARRVIHDTLERQLYFEGAQFRVAGLPVAYIPRLRIPDPSVDRAPGILIPRLRTSSQLGTGIKVPYFVPLGAHADVTLTPYLSSSTRTLELEYRQMLSYGEIEFSGAASDDDIEGSRGYLFGQARYRLPRDFIATLRLELASDPGYLFQYNYSERDRLRNEIDLARVRDKDLFRASITEFRSFREADIAINDQLPDRHVEVGYIRDIPSLSFGGRTTARVDAAALNRPSSDDIVGRDVSRIGVGLDWQRTAIFGPGIVGKGELGLRADVFNTDQDTGFTQNVTRTVPRAAVELRWPLVRQTGRVAETLEPIARIDVSRVGGAAVPLEDSRIVEFDEANLFAPSRYPGLDGVEDGVRVALGGAWRRETEGGVTTDVTLGRVVNLDGDLGFAEGTGLEGDQSEWLVAGRLGLQGELWVTSRALFDDQLNFTLSETRIDWTKGAGSLSTSYIRAAPEPAENRTIRLSEWSFEGRYDLSDRWAASTDWRYDFTAGRAARVGLGLDYRNECLELDLSLSRRYATSSSVSPTTDFGFRVSLLGVGAGGDREATRRGCKGS